MTVVTFDPPRYDIALEVIGLVVTISVIPMLIWHLYRIVVAYQSKRTWFLAVFLVQAVCSLSYEFLALYTTFINTNVYLTIIRTDLASSTILLMPFVLREIMTTFAVADPSIPAWAPNVVCGLLLVIFFATMTPRYFLYILYVSVREDSFIAKWGSISYLNPLLALVIYEFVFLFTLWTLYKQRESIRELMAQSYADFSSTDTGSKWSLAPAKPKSTAQPSSLIRAASPPGTAHRKGFVQPWFLCGLAMMRIGDAAIAGVALNMLAVMACQSILSYCLNAAAITALPPPSFEWRLSQQYYALGGACTSIICVICWQIIVDLKRLLVADHRHPGMTHSSFSAAVETSHGTMTTHLPHLPHVAGVGVGGGGRYAQRQKQPLQSSTMTIDGNEA